MRLWSNLKSIFQRRQRDAEMAEEMRHHLELQTERNVAEGMDANDAHYAALRLFGNRASIQDQVRDARSWVWLEHWNRDFRFSARSLRRSAGFTGTVIITLALCIGANTTIMSVLYGLILKPLPFHNAGHLVEIYTSQLKAGPAKGKVGVQQYLDYKANANLFEGFALWNGWAFSTEEDGNPVRGAGARVTADYFQILGVQPLLGRFFTQDESVPGKDAVLVLTQTYWETEFQGDPGVIGRVVKLSGQQFTIIGVAPRSLEALNSDTTVLKPFEWRERDAAPQYRGSLGSTMYARVKPDVAHDAALAQLATLEKNFFDHVAGPDLREYLTRNGSTMGLGKIRVEQTKSVQASLAILQGSALLMLLLGSVNVANLMLARANAKQTELAVRQALGAGRGALVRQMFVEGLLLAGGGAAIGLALTWTSLRVVNTYMASIIREVQPIVVDSTVLGLTILSALLIALAIALLPVVKTWQTSMLVSLQGRERTASAGGSIRTASSLLVMAQVALALMLVVGAGLLLRSFGRVLAVNPGFDAKQVVQGQVVFGSRGQSRDSIKSMQDLIVERMKEIPGVEKVGYTFESPLSPIKTTSNFPIRGITYGSVETHPTAMLVYASPEYFAAMGMRLLEGRTFTEDDLRPQARLVYVVDQTFAERYFPGRSPVGETFDFWNPERKPDRWPMIIGVVTAAKLGGLDDISGMPFVFGQRPAMQDFTLLLRTALPADVIVPLMREKLRSVDPSAPLYGIGSLQENLDRMLANRRGVMWLLGTFAGIALLLSALGIYGMLAYDVAQRTKEIGIRGALGATRGQIVGLILKQGLRKSGIGLAVGLVGAIYLSRYLGSLLFEVKPTDPLVFIGVTLVLLVVSLLASWLPARRAAKIDPIIALRAE